MILRIDRLQTEMPPPSDPDPGRRGRVISLAPAQLELSEAYGEGDETARWEIQPDGSRERHTVG